MTEIGLQINPQQATKTIAETSPLIIATYFSNILSAQSYNINNNMQNVIMNVLKSKGLING